MLIRKIVNHLQLFAIVLLGFVLASCDDGSGPDKIVDEGNGAAAMQLVWSDEFDVDGPPDVRYWTMETGYGDNGWGNDEWQNYTSDTDSENNNVRVENGNLVITARCTGTSAECADQAAAKRTGLITSSRINTAGKFDFKYGNIQARIKTPPGKGTWPAFWMLGSIIDELPWPAAGEIDVMEMHQFFSNDRTTHATIHYCDERLLDIADGDSVNTCFQDGGRVFESEFLTFDSPLTSDYHVYEVDWSQDRIIGKIDGVTYYSRPIDPEYMEEFLRSYFIILNIAVGGTLGGPPDPALTWPQEMLVDWVRVYQRVVDDDSELVVVPDDPAIPLPFVRTLNSVEFGGDSVPADIRSTAVTPLDGETTVEFDYQSANTFFSGAAFNFRSIDLTPYTRLVFGLNTSQFANFDDIGIEISDIRFAGDGFPGRVNIPLSNYTETGSSGDWKIYDIPLTDFVGVNLRDVINVGLWNPEDASNRLIAGKLYLDNTRFIRDACATQATVNLDSDTYNTDTSVGAVTVVDQCSPNSFAVVEVEADTGKIGVGVGLDASGTGSSRFFMSQLNSKCVTEDATNTVRRTSDSVLLNASLTTDNGLIADVAGFDAGAPPTTLTGGKEFFYATDPNQALTYLPDVDFIYSVFDSAATLDGAASDTRFTPVFSVTDNIGYASVAMLDNPDDPGLAGFADGKQSFDFKVKNLPTNAPTANQIQVIFGDPVTIVTVDVTASPYSTDIGDGWYQVSVPMSLYPDTAAYFYVNLQVENASGETFLITDMHMTQVLPTIAAECIDSFLGAYSETYTDQTITPTGTFNAGVFGGRDTPSDTNSTVNVYEGSVSFEINYRDVSGFFSGAGFDFAGDDVSVYNTLVFAIDTSGVANYADLVVQLEPSGSPSDSVFLSNYPPVSTSGNWTVHEIPLSDFPNLNKSALTRIGFWNLSSATGSVVLTSGLVYIDDIHFVK